MTKQQQGATLSPKVVPLISLMFGTLDALYIETRRLPLPFVTNGENNNKPKDKPDVFTLGLFFEGQDYVTLRSILALMGDLTYVLKNLGGVKMRRSLGSL